MGPAGAILKGDYKGALSYRGFINKRVVIQQKFKEVLEINSETVERMEVLSEDSKGAGKATLGGALFGTTGAVIGAAGAKKERMVAIYFKDGKKILAKCNQEMFELLQTVLF